MRLYNMSNYSRILIGSYLVMYRGILVYTICLIGISNSVSDGATNISLLNIERSQYD